MTTILCVRRLAAILILLSVAGRAAPAAGQTPESVREAAIALLGPGFTQAEIDSVATVLALQIATFPTGSSSGGFTYVFENGAVREVQSSFGPLFAERAPTLGVQGAMALGVNVQSTRFVSFEGEGLRNGDLATTVVIADQLRELERFTFDVSTQTMTFVGTIAFDDDKDLSVIVPVVRTTLSGTRRGLLPLPGGSDVVVDVTQTGIGDMAVRGKWAFMQMQDGKGGLAAVAEIYFPTGDEERLSTASRVRFKPMLAASGTFNSFAPHINIGYTFGGPGTVVEDTSIGLPLVVSAEAGDEINYVMGGEVAPIPSVTLFADLIGRTLRNVARYSPGRREVQTAAFGLVDLGTLIARNGTLNLRLAAVGAKLQILGSSLLSLGLVFPLNEGGIKPGLTPVVGFEYTFGRRVAGRSSAAAALISGLFGRSSTGR